MKQVCQVCQAEVVLLRAAHSSRCSVLQFFSEYPAMGDHPLLLKWHGSAMICRIVWEFVEGFLERISRLLGSVGGRKSVPIWEKREFIGIDAR